MSIGVGAKRIGLAKVKRGFRTAIKKYGGSPSAQVGVGTDYGVPVHEIMEANHKVGNAKFLEGPFDQMRPTYKRQLAKRVRVHSRSSHPLHIALYEMALKLDAAMVPQIPVQFGRLRSTHYVAPPKGIRAGAAPAKPKSTKEGRALAVEALLP